MLPCPPLFIILNGVYLILILRFSLGLQLGFYLKGHLFLEDSFVSTSYFILSVWIFTMCMQCLCRPEKAVHPLERKLQVVARHRVSAGKLNRGPLQKQQVRLLIEHLSSPVPPHY